MLSSVLLISLLVSPVQTPATPMPAAKTLFAEEQWYKDAKGDEKTIDAVVMVNKGDGRIGIPERFNGFRIVWLEDGKPMTRQLYSNGKDELLAAFQGNAGKAYTVRITGKLIDEAGAKKVSEFWPAKVEVVAEVPYGVIGDVKVLAKAGNNQWYLNVVRRDREAKPYIFRDPKELVPLMGYQGVPDAEKQASTYISQILRIPNNKQVDWTKNMVVALTGGTVSGQNIMIDISRVAISESGGLDIYWKYSTGVGGAGVSYPIETIMIPKSDGEITFREEGTSKKITVPALEKKEEEKKEEKKEEKPK